MRAKEFLLEYNRQIAAKNTSPKIIQALAADQSLNLPRPLQDLENLVASLTGRGELAKLDQQKAIEVILAAMEEQDPTPNKQYTQWMARMYSKGGLNYEDINRHNMIALHAEAKRRNMLRPEHKDINRFKTYEDFEDTMFDEYSIDEIMGNEEDESEKPQAKKVFENDQVLIVVPENEAAACKYGRQTRWCTAATSGYNYFDQYNRQGQLYILIPKQPKHHGEKYQLHFESGSYMDEEDDEIELFDVIVKRFGPEVKEFFQEHRPELKDSIVFLSDQELLQYIDIAKDTIQEMIWEHTSDWEIEDDSYYEFLRGEGFVDEDGDIDWDAVEKAGWSYSEYNDEVRRAENSILGLLDDIDSMRELSSEYTGATDQIKDIPDFIGRHFTNLRHTNHSDTVKYIAGKIGETLIEKYRLVNTDDKWEMKNVRAN